MFDAEREYQTWRRWLDVIHQDLMGMQAHQQMWHGYREMLRENPAIQSPGSFHLWLASSHATAQAVGIRRQADTDSRVISLARLLQRVERHPEILSRERYVATQGPGWEDDANRWFDGLAGPGAVHLPASIPEKDLEALRAKVESVRRYVNMRVAHHDAAELQRIPSYGDIDEALAFVLDLHRKYHVLLTGVSLHDEVILQPWEAIFYRPWIREGPATPETADRLAIRKFAKLSEGAKKELLRVLTAESRVRADVIRQLFDRPDTRDLAEVLMDLEGDELLRDSVVRLLPIMEDG